MRRPRVPWMTQSDDDILEFLANRPVGPIVASPRIINANVGYTNRTIRRRLASLRDAGLVAYFDEDSGIYEITEKGLDYLDGSLEKSELERDDGD